MTAVLDSTLHLQQQVNSTLAALDGLGDNAAQVADRLQHLGVTGLPGSPHRCVIARYLGTLPGVTGAEVVATRAWIQTDGDVFTVAVPIPVTEVIRGFDAGLYPGLVAPLVVTGTSLPGGER